MIQGSKTAVSHLKTISAAHGGTGICKAGAGDGKMETNAEKVGFVMKPNAGGWSKFTLSLLFKST
jgi:hypothetical protein